MRNPYTVFFSGYINLHSHQQHKSFSFLHTLTQHLLFLVFLIIAIWKGVRHLIVVLICISMMTKDTEYFFVYLLSICMSLANVYSDLPIINQIVYFFCYWVVWVLCMFYILSPYPYKDFYILFSRLRNISYLSL